MRPPILFRQVAFVNQFSAWCLPFFSASHNA
jgi:hypothetical protein